MRPRKTVLYVDADAGRRSVRTLQLEMWGYRAVMAESREWALRVLEAVRYEPSARKFTDQDVVDVVVVELGVSMALELVCAAKKLHPAMPVLVLSETPASYPLTMAANAFLPTHPSRWALELRETLHVLTSRKRGPKRVEIADVVAGRKAG